MTNKILSVLVTLVLMAATGAVGYYYGGKSSPLSTGLSTIGEIVYDREAEARFDTQIGILDAQLAEQTLALAQSEQRNEGLLRRVYNWEEAYEATQVKVEIQQEENQKNFELVSTDLERSIIGNLKAKDDLVELNNIFIANRNLFQGQLDKASEYISVLEDANAGLKAENTLLNSINDAITNQNQMMRERIEDISGARARHGPGIAMGLNPMDNYQLTALVGWTVSWS